MSVGRGEPRRDRHTASARGARTSVPPLDRIRASRDRLFDVGAPDAAPHRRPAPAYVFFALTVLIYPIHQMLTLGRWILDGTMWAEMAVNYYVTATSSSLAEQLFATDAGYIPLPQRLIATVTSELGLPYSAVPHVYTWSAIISAALLVATVCLPVFRPVISSDGLRFLLAIALVLVPEFQTRTFINFTYLAVVPLVAVTALAAVRREVPRWAWLLPLFMLSKPGVLAVLPAMVVVGLLSTGRFRRIAIVSTVLGLVQVVRLAVSGATGNGLLQAGEDSPLIKLVTAVKYTFGMIGRLLVGPDSAWTPRAWMLAGIVAVLLLGAAALLLRSRAAPLVLIGLSLVAFTMVVNAFTFSYAFGRDMAGLATTSLDRRFIVAVMGVLFVAVGVLAMVFESPRLVRPWGRFSVARVARTGSVAATALFALWFVVSGWLDYTGRINQPFGVPYADVGQWQEMSPLLANPGEPIVCVPVDPFGWVYGRQCINLLQEQGVPGYLAWSPAEGGDAAAAGETPTDGTSADDGATVDGAGGSTGGPAAVPAGYVVEPSVPDEVRSGRLASLGLLVRPAPGVAQVSGRAIVTAQDGYETVFTAAVDVPSTGGLVQFLTRPTPLILDVESVRFVFDQPVDIASDDPEDIENSVIVLWLGQP